MKEQSTSKGFAILSAANIIIKLLSFLYLPFLLKILHGEGYGIYSAAYQVYVFIYVIANSGLPAAISKIVAEFSALGNYRDSMRSFKLARSILFLAGIIMSLLLFMFALPLTKVLHYEKSYLAILALCPSVFITSVASSYRGYFQGMGNMTPTAVSQIVEQLANTIFTLLLAVFFMRYSVEAACAGGAAATTLAAVFSLFTLIVFFRKNKSSVSLPSQRSTNIPASPGKQLLSRIINYSIPITLCVGMQYAGNLVDLGNTKTRLLVAGFSDAKATEMYGYLAKFQQLVNVPLSIVVALTAVIMPAISGAIALKNKELVESKFNYAFRLCFIITIPCACVLSILSTPVYDILKFQPGSYLMQYGSVIIVLMAVLLLQTTILQGAGRFNTATTNALLGIAVKIAANYFLIARPELNINGALIGSILGYLVSISLNSVFIGRLLKIKYSLFKPFSKPFISSVATSLIAYFIYFRVGNILNISKTYALNSAFTLSAIILCSFIYIFILILIGGITKEEQNILPSAFSKRIPKFLKNRII